MLIRVCRKKPRPSSSNIQAAAANTDPHSWYMTGTSRASGEPTSYEFAIGGRWKVPLPYPSTWGGYNTVAQDQINQVSLIGGPDQQTVGTVISTSPTTPPATSKRFTTVIPEARQNSATAALRRRSERASLRVALEQRCGHKMISPSLLIFSHKMT